MELIGDKNQLTIVFDKALKGKKIQIEPFRGRPDINTAKDYVRITTIKEQEKAKLVKKLITNLFVSAECCEGEEGDISYTNVKGLTKLYIKDWHNPVDNPMLCLYTQNGNLRPRYNTFGDVRIERTNKPRHQGVDLLALPDSNVYACMDGEVVRAGDSGGGYGNIITIKVKEPSALRLRKRSFSLIYQSEGEIAQGPNFNENGDLFIFYAHLKTINVNIGDYVECGKVIGVNGTSGFGTTKDPHLHYEILNKKRAGGLNNRVHPGFYCYYKSVADMTQEDKDYQKKIAKTYWN